MHMLLYFLRARSSYPDPSSCLQFAFHDYCLRTYVYVMFHHTTVYVCKRVCVCVVCFSCLYYLIKATACCTCYCAVGSHLYRWIKRDCLCACMIVCVGVGYHGVWFGEWSSHPESLGLVSSVWSHLTVSREMAWSEGLALWWDEPGTTKNECRTHDIQTKWPN